MGSESVKKVTAEHPHASVATSAPGLSKELLKEWRAHVGTAKPDAAKLTGRPKPDAQMLTAEPGSDEPFNTKDDDTAVEDIIKKEGDEVIEAEDAAGHPLPEPPKPKKHRLRKVLKILFVLIFIGGAIAMTFPSSRYFILNAAGVRSKASVQVLDSETRLPLKNVTVAVGNASARTDSTGQAVVKDIKLGKHSLMIKRVAFTSVEESVTIGWGSNPLGEFLLKATGVQYTIRAQDYVSGVAIKDVEARSGEAVAVAADDGTLTLTLEEADSDTIPLTLSAKQYRTETINFRANQLKPVDIRMVPAAKEVFLARQSGRYNLVSMYIDGKDQRVILPGTGSETANSSLAVDPAGIQAALVSHRDDLRGAQGQVINTLRLVSVDGSASQMIARAEHITLADWIGTTLIFQESNTTGNADDPERYKLISYDYATGKRVELATANQFNAVHAIKGKIYYAAAGMGSKPAVYASVAANGSGRQTIIQGEVWAVVRTAYDRLLLQTPTTWLAYTPGGGQQPSTQPASFASRYYAEGPNQQSIWLDIQDGKGTVMIHDNMADKDTIVATQNNMVYPVRWLNDTTIIARVSSANDAADYVVSLQGGAPKKITNVVNAYGVNRQ